MHKYSDQTVQTKPGAVDMVCYRSFEQAESIKDQWDGFVERIGADLFCSFDWCRTWWKHFSQGRSLEIYVASIEGKTAAILPMFREDLRWGPVSLIIVRLVGTDHLTVGSSLAIETGRTESVAGAMISQLNQNGRWDVIHFGELAGYCENAGAFALAIQGCDCVGKVAFSDNDYPHMVFDIQSSFEEYMETLSGKERHNVRRDERYFSATANVTCCQPESLDDFEKAMDRLIVLHTEHWNNRGRLGHFGEWPGVAAFHREIGGKLLESGRLLFVEIYRDDNLSISEYGGFFGQRLHWIINARAHDVVSTRVGFCAVLRRAVAAGVKQIDAGNGIFDYKRRLGAHVLGVKNITITNHRVSARLRLRVMRIIVWLVELVYFRLWFWHLAPWIRRKWPWLRIGWLKKGMWVRFIRAKFLVADKCKTIHAE